MSATRKIFSATTDTHTHTLAGNPDLAPRSSSRPRASPFRFPFWPRRGLLCFLHPRSGTRVLLPTVTTHVVGSDGIDSRWEEGGCLSVGPSGQCHACLCVHPNTFLGLHEVDFPDVPIFFLSVASVSPHVRPDGGRSEGRWCHARGAGSLSTTFKQLLERFRRRCIISLRTPCCINPSCQEPPPSPSDGPAGPNQPCHTRRGVAEKIATGSRPASKR